MSDANTEERLRIERILQDPLARLPMDMQAGYYDFQYRHYRRFLLLVSLLGQAAYLSYWLADLILIPDVGTESLIARLGFTLLVLPLTLAMFRWCKKIAWLDLLLPVCILLASSIWFELLARSRSDHVATYQYASVIFIVLANLSIQVQFLPALMMSLLIAGVTAEGVNELTASNPEAMLVFALVYLPVLLFSLFISWSTTLERRRAYLRSLSDELTRLDLGVANRRLQEMAHTDPLTGLSNRRQFDAMANSEMARCKGQGDALSLLLFEVKDFKQIVETHGRPTGDKILQIISATALHQIREQDTLARVGDGEFAALLPYTGMQEALSLAERLTESIAQCRVLAGSGESLQFKACAGVAQVTEKITSAGALIQAADRALYLAKRGNDSRAMTQDLPH